MAKKIIEAVKKIVKKTVVKKVAKKEEVVKAVRTCSECNGRGLKDSHTLCVHCAGSGTL